MCDGLGLLGVALAGAANDASEQIISSLDSRVTVLVVPTDEEAEIARLTLDTVERIRS